MIGHSSVHPVFRLNVPHRVQRGHPILGISVPHIVSKGHAPLPLRIGVQHGTVGFQTALPWFKGGKVTPVVTRTGGGGWTEPEWHPKKPSYIKDILRDDEDLLELIEIIVTSGILE